MSIEFIKKLPLPEEVREAYPLSRSAAQCKREKDAEIIKIFKGESNKKLLIIGPCSADREDAVLEYVYRLARVQEEVKDSLLLVPRIYTNKPRTTGDGYKGMLHQPDPHNKPDVFKGVLAIRELHTRVITETGLPTADEMLYPGNYRYLSDLLSYVAIGARSVENQEHRLVSSGMDCPVGMKNPTSGDISVMLNAVIAARHSHTFIYSGYEVTTSGNPLSHSILRGYVNKRGQSMPNYHYEDLNFVAENYAKRGIDNAALIVDANHANSGKIYEEQPRICKDVIYSCNHNESIKRLVKGFMVESYLEDGCQPASGDRYGCSITDPCLGWEKSKKLIYQMAEEL